MDIACPNCAATYRVPDSLLARRMALRCAACDHEWMPEAPRDVTEVPSAPEPAPPAEGVAPPAPAPEPPPLEPPPPEPPPAPPLAAAPRRERPAPPTTPPPLQRRGGPGRMGAKPRVGAVRRLALPIAWAASIALVVVALAGLVVFGEEIALAWPPFARVTSLLSG